MGQFSCPLSKDAKRQEKIRQDNTFPSRRHDKPGMSYKGNGRSMLVEQKKMHHLFLDDISRVVKQGVSDAIFQ